MVEPVALELMIAIRCLGMSATPTSRNAGRREASERIYQHACGGVDLRQQRPGDLLQAAH
jgi:hypothetical protein